MEAGAWQARLGSPSFNAIVAISKPVIENLSVVITAYITAIWYRGMVDSGG